MPPTLLKKGSIVPNKPDEDLSDVVAIDHVMKWFADRQNKRGIENRVLILKSDTGSGKSTAFPAYLFDKFWSRGMPKIGVTQPRVMNAITIVRDQLAPAPYYPKLKIDETIGWSTGDSKRKPKVGLLFMTLGTLAAQLQNASDEKFIGMYSYIVIDEVHESSLEQAMMLYMLKNFLYRNKDNPNLPYVTLTSATFDERKFLKYFGIDRPDEHQPNYISVTGFTYPCHEHWDYDLAPANYVEEAAKKAISLHLDMLDDKPDNADFLIFLPGVGEMKQVEKILNAEQSKFPSKLINAGKTFIVLQLKRTAPGKKDMVQKLVFETPMNRIKTEIKGKKYPIMRRIILSTNIAETGVTIESLKLVIDPGMNKGPEYNPQFNVSGVITKPAAQSNIRQRKGRANRISEGHFYPLYSIETYKSLPEIQLAEIEKSDTSEIILSILHEQIKDKHLQRTVGAAEGSDDSLGEDLINNIIGYGDMRAEAGQDEQKKLLGDSSGTQNKSSTISAQGAKRPQIELDSALDLLDTPSDDTLQPIFERLYQLGFISPFSNYHYVEPSADLLDDIKRTDGSPVYSLTKLGAIASYFTRHNRSEFIRMIFAGYMWEVSILDLVTIAAYLDMDARDFVEDNRRPVKWLSIYAEGLPGKYLDMTSPETTKMRIKMLIGDDFIDGLILFNAISSILRRSKLTDCISSFDKFCTTTGLSIIGVKSFLEIREDMLDKMLEMGFDVFKYQNIFELPAESFMDALVRVKYCIYDGFKVNLLRWDGATYRNMQNIAVKIPPILSKNEKTIIEERKYGVERTINPRYLVYNKQTLTMNKVTNMYGIEVDRVAIMDGYVNIDI